MLLVTHVVYYKKCLVFLTRNSQIVIVSKAENLT